MVFMPRKILLINIFGIGDVLFTTPLISNIKENLPECFIGYVCNKRTAPILASNPKINKVFVFEKDEYRGLLRKSKIDFFKKICSTIKEIRSENFDTLIDVSLNSQVNFFTRFTGIPERIGFNYKNRSPFLTKKVELKSYESKHVVDYYLELLQGLGFSIKNHNLEIFPSAEDSREISDLLAKNGIKSNDKLIAVIPGGGASWGKDAVHKRWSAEKYAQLSDKIIENSGGKVILLGDQNEKDLCRNIASSMNQKPLDLSGELSILKLAAILKKCRFAIVNDGGPLHIAVAAGVKTVSIFGPVDENVYGPYPSMGHFVVIKDIACRPCYRRFRLAQCEHHKCLDISVLDVFKKTEKLL